MSDRQMSRLITVTFKRFLGLIQWVFEQHYNTVEKISQFWIPSLHYSLAIHSTGHRGSCMDNNFLQVNCPFALKRWANVPAKNGIKSTFITFGVLLRFGPLRQIYLCPNCPWLRLMALYTKLSATRSLQHKCRWHFPIQLAVNYVQL